MERTMKRVISLALLAALLVAASAPGQATIYLPLVAKASGANGELCDPMLPELIITDGTTTIDLLSNGNSGFHLLNWRPAVADYKGGGTWRDSALSDGRRLVSRQFANAIETLELKINGATQDDVVRNMQDLRRLLEKAADYWATEWQDEPVWIEARAACETNERYAIIQRGRIPEDDMPYGGTFFSSNHRVGMDDITLIVERGHWLAEEPGEVACVEASGEQTWHKEYQPTQSADDCHVNQTGGVISIVAVAHDMGNNAGNVYDAGVRFRSVVIPQGATILAAYARLRSSAALGGTTCNIDIFGEDNSTPAVFSTVADFNGRTRTTARVDWDNIPAWAAQTYYLSPDISTVVQEIVDRDDWASGNNMVIFFEDDSSSVNAYRRWYSWDSGNVGNEPELFVWYRHGGMFGRASTCEDEIYFANKHNKAQLTDIYYYDISAANFGANLINAALPFSLTPPAPIQTNDAIYFGIDTNFADSGPFCSLVFDLGTAATYGAGDSAQWEYWNGGAWVALTVQDNTDAGGAMTGQPLDTAGVGSVHWIHPSDWATTSVNAVTGYWVRLNFTVATGVTGATQQNRSVYSILWPYVEVDEGQVLGDIPALAALRIHNQSGRLTNLDMYSDRIVAGLRSLSRGTDFTAFINLSDTQMPTGVTFTPTGGIATVVADITGATGRAFQYAAGAALALQFRGVVALSSSISEQYAGTYHCFVRVKQTAGAAGAIRLQLSFSLGNALATLSNRTPLVATQQTGQFELLDMGQVTIPPFDTSPNETLGTVNVGFYLENDANGDTLHLYELIIIPVDEWAVDSIENLNSSSTTSLLMEYDRYLDLDSATYPKSLLRSLLKEVSDDSITEKYPSVTGGPAIYQANADQRLWFLSERPNNYSLPRRSEPYIADSFWSEGVYRYLSMRGAR